MNLYHTNGRNRLTSVNGPPLKLWNSEKFGISWLKSGKHGALDKATGLPRIAELPNHSSKLFAQCMKTIAFFPLFAFIPLQCGLGHVINLLKMQIKFLNKYCNLHFPQLRIKYIHPHPLQFSTWAYIPVLGT